MAWRRPRYLFHGTTNRHKESILANGINAGSYWSNRPDIAWAFALNRTLPRERPALLALPIDRFNLTSFHPDMNMVHWPVRPIRSDEDLGVKALMGYKIVRNDIDLKRRWRASRQTFWDALRIFHAAIYEEHIEVHEQDMVEAPRRFIVKLRARA